MAWDIIYWGELITLLMVAVAVGMDAFSLGIGIGISGVQLGTVLRISFTVGIFHVIMPLFGIVTGYYLSSLIGEVATFIGGFILCLLGINMLWNGLFPMENGKKNEENKIGHLSVLLFSLSVSMDALSVGFSFGLFEVNKFFAVLIFGVVSMMMTGSGILLGRSAGDYVGSYGIVIGGIILLIFGIKFLT